MFRIECDLLRLLPWPGFQTVRRPCSPRGSIAIAASVFACVAPVVPGSAEARGTDAAVALASLPVQAQTTYRLILEGGPYPYPKDGIVFGNRERQLPGQQRGYYREYTVATPRSHDRGARRIVCGGPPPAPPAACYYTDDHYASFRRIQP